MIPRLLLLLTPVLAAALGVGAAGAQQPVPLFVAPAATGLERAADLYGAGEASAALEVLEAHLSRHPDHHEGLWRAARAAASVGLLADGEEEQNRWFRRGERHGERAVLLEPEGLDGLYWLAVNKGRLAIQQPPRATAGLAREVHLLAHRILALDSLHAGAWNALGKIDYEVMRLSGFERFLARLFLGNEALRGTSWERAERHHRRAVALDGESPLFRLDLGTTLLFTGRYDEAAEELARALSLPRRHPGDALYQDEARRWLRFARERRRP